MKKSNTCLLSNEIYTFDVITLATWAESTKAVEMQDQQLIKFENAKCVWKLDCPFCGWIFGFVLDLTDERVTKHTIFLIDGKPRKPDHFPKKLAGRVFAELHVRNHKCMRCKAFFLREDEIRRWLKKQKIDSNLDFDFISEKLDLFDPTGNSAIVHTDRIYDYQFDDWGVDGYPSRYVFIKNEKEFIDILRKDKIE